MTKEQIKELVELVDVNADVDNMDEDELENVAYDCVRIFHIKKKYFSIGIRIMWEQYFGLSE